MGGSDVEEHVYTGKNHVCNWNLVAVGLASQTTQVIVFPGTKTPAATAAKQSLRTVDVLSYTVIK